MPSEEDVTLDSETGSTVSILDSPELLQGRALRNSQWLAMFMKIYFYSIRNYIITLLKITTPTLFVLLTIIAARAFARVTKLPALPLDRSIYEFRTETVMQRNFTDGSPFIINVMENYQRDVASGPQSAFVRSTDENIVPHLLRIGRHSFAEFTRHFVISASFGEDQIVALFSNQYHHTTAVSLQHTYNALLKEVSGPSYSLRARNYPLPFTTSEGVSLLVYFKRAMLKPNSIADQFLRQPRRHWFPNHVEHGLWNGDCHGPVHHLLHQRRVLESKVTAVR